MSKWEHVRLRIETKQDLSEVKKVEMTDEPTLSTHILDTSIGKAVKNVIITVYKLVNDAWTPVCQSETDSDGRVSQLLSPEQYQGGVFKLSFDVKPYFAANKIKSFYPFIEIIVECEFGQHYHVPLLLNPFGYSTYRGT